MDNKRLEILSNMRLFPLEDKDTTYETIVNYTRELFGPRRIVLYVKDDTWKREYSYPSEEMLGFELKDEYLDNIYEKFAPCIFSFEEAKDVGINLEGITIFLSLGTKELPIGVLVLAGIKGVVDEIKEELPVLKIFSRYIEALIYNVKKFDKKREEENIEDNMVSTLKHDIVSMLSREVRTPLSSILAYAETLKETEDLSEKEKKDFIETIYKEALKLKEIMDRIMDYLSMLVEE